MEKHADQDLDYAEKLAFPSRHPTSSNGGPSVQPDASSNEGGPYKVLNYACKGAAWVLPAVA